MDRDELVLFEESLSRFNRERYDPARWVKYGRLPETYCPDLWSEMRDLGWFELLRPEEGHETAPLANLLGLFKAAGEALWREPIASVLGEPVAVVAALPDRQRRQALLDGLISGERPLAYAHREPGRVEGAPQVGTRVRAANDGYVLRGYKALVVGDAVCAAFIVSAFLPEGKGLGLFLVDAQAPGLKAQRYRTVDDRIAADVQFDDVSAELLCRGTAALHDVRCRGLILAAAESIGIMRGANHDTIEYLRQRRQFGQPLLGFQTLQHRLVEMSMQQRESEALIREVTEAYDQGAPNIEHRALTLRVQVSQALRHITGEAIQMHGGMGVTQELRIGRYYRRALMLDSLYGTADSALATLAEI